MGELIVANKSDITNIADAVRSQTGILNECKVYNYAISDEDMNSFLTL